MPRGYVENLEAKCASMESRLKELEAALALERSVREDNGGPGAGPMSGGLKRERHVRTGNDISFQAVNVNGNGNGGSGGIKAGTYLNGSSRSTRVQPQLHNGTAHSDDKIRGFRAGCYYLGLSSGASTLHSMKDSALSVLGIEIDLSEIDPEDANYAGIEGGMNDSYASCLSSMFNANPSAPQKLELPSREECMGCAEWFYSYSYTYLPIIHRPTFMQQVGVCYRP